MSVSLIVVDSKGDHKAGAAKEWKNRITLKHRFYQSGEDRVMELRAVPEAAIYYTTDGSNPRVAGALYNGDFVIPPSAPMVLAYAKRDGVESQVEQIIVPAGGPGPDNPWLGFDAQRPAIWQRRHGYNSTKESFEFLERLEKYKARVHGLQLTITGDSGDQGWIELNTADGKEVTPEQVKAFLDVLRQVQTGQITLAASNLHFVEGIELQAWVEDAKLTVQPGEWKQ